MRHLTFIFVAIILFNSCTTQEFEELTEVSSLLISEQNHVISADEAIRLAREAIMTIPNEKFLESRSQNDYDGASVSVVTNNDVPLYIVNFKNGGYAIVHGQSEAKEPVLIMSADEYFETNALNPNSPANFLLNLATKYTPEDDPSNTIIPNDNPDAPFIIEHNGHTCNVYVTRDTIGSKEKHMVRTLWNQTYPYNFFCPTINGRPCLAGCLPVAMAQIMSYHYKPTSYNNHTYNWGAIHSTITKSSPGDAGAIDIAHLLHDLGELMDSDYGLDATGTNWYKAPLGFTTFGYHTPYECAFSFEVAREELNAQCPILAMGTNSSTGGCHAWVIDGLFCVDVIQQYRRVDNNVPCDRIVYTEDKFLHCNWGWGGYQNTFVRPNLFLNYDTNIRIYTQIY